MEGHVIEKCYKLNGYPPGHKLYGKNKGGTTFANQSTAQVGIDFEEDGESNFSITQAQYQELMSLLKNKEPMGSPSANQVHTLPSSNSKASTMSSKHTCLSIPHHTYLGYLIQDYVSWTTIGKGKMEHGLYHLMLRKVPSDALATTFSNFSISKVPISASVNMHMN
ncbi:UNVERIFIED_CONTAM: hypothetical protein Sradi_0486700 [Sesamum radiatum]|uniref:Uncharacterized protein n=1 Tax=Sesamum radiatum TaxID=300843 RepID=A0AAW2W7W7_SESRA